MTDIKFQGKVEKDFLFCKCSNLTVINAKIVDSSGSEAAHRDGIQIIGYEGDPLAASKIQSIYMQDVIIQAEGYLQGVFVGDGYINEASFDNVHIKTKSQHSITLAGLRVGEFIDCSTSTPIQLLPLRLFGGTENGSSIWIIDDDVIKYGKITSTGASTVLDLRREERKGWNFYDVNCLQILEETDIPTLPVAERRQIFIEEAIKRMGRMSIIR